MQKSKFKIQGLKCENCVLLIEERLKGKLGVVKVKVDQSSNKGVVIYDDQKINEGDIYKTIEEIGGFRVEKIDGSEKSIEEPVNYNNPDDTKEAKPPIEAKNNKGILVVATIAILLFSFFMFGQKNGLANLAGGSAKNDLTQAGPKGDVVGTSDNPVLEAYVVSRCPFGLQMQRVLADVVKNIPSVSENIKIRYMGAVSNGTISSMHGDAEAQENLRQICLREEQPSKYWPYVSCQMKSAGTEKSCEAPSGVDSTKLNACVSDASRGLTYAQKDFALDEKYQIQGSPTLILNGQKASEFSFGGRTSDALKSVVCSGFSSQPEFCSTKLATTDAATSFSAGY